MGTLTIIDSLMIEGSLSNGRYLIDKDCDQADLSHVVRKLTDEDAYDAWNSQRSDHAHVVIVDGDSTRVEI